jgi:hypothetical protein
MSDAGDVLFAAWVTYVYQCLPVKVLLCYYDLYVDMYGQ